MSASESDDAALESLRAIVAPLARLAVNQGIPFAHLEEELKQAMVAAARDTLMSQSDKVLAHRLTSRVTTMTGINRREVTRIVRAPADQAPLAKPSPALRVFTRWATDPRFADPQGEPQVLPLNGPAPSFESLAALVTRDVHHRSLLEELLRLGAVTEDLERRTVKLQRKVLVPEQSERDMLRFLAKNAGDHLQVAVDNVLGDRPKQLEQAVYADGLSAESLALLKPWIEGRWRNLLADLTSLLQQRVDVDSALGEAAQGSVRVGMFAKVEDQPRPPADRAMVADSELSDDKGETT